MILTSTSAPWTATLLCPLLARIGPASAELIAHIGAVGSAAGLALAAESSAASEEFRNDVVQAIDELPAAIKCLLDKKLLGVYFGRGLGSSAVSDIVVGAAGAILGTAVVLDLDVLEHSTANAWATWKENTPFHRDGPVAVAITIENDENDTRQNALQYLLGMRTKSWTTWR